MPIKCTGKMHKIKILLTKKLKKLIWLDKILTIGSIGKTDI